MVARVGSDTQFVTGYERDSLSRITRLTETVQGVTHDARFTYDTAGRLQTVTRDGILTAAYSYDANGNRLSRTTPGGTVAGAYDDQDRMTSYGAATYSYGANGELQVKVVGTDTTKYTYDALGNLTHVGLPDGTAIDYLIDAQNRRIGKKVNGVLVQGFLYQGQLTPVAELDGSGNVVSRFVYASGINVPDYMVKGGKTYRLIRDHLGSVRLVVDVATDSVAQRVDYDEFGVETQNTNPGFQAFGYAGGLTDAATGLVRFGARDYDPASGRWTAKDPTGFGGGSANQYSHTYNDPVNDVDPDGLETIVIISGDGIIGAHAAVFVNNGGSEFGGERVLYDPGGSYRPSSYEPGQWRPSGDAFVGDEVNVSDYVSWHLSVDQTVRMFVIETTPEQEAEIAARISEAGGQMGGLCASAVSNVINGIGPVHMLHERLTPGGLKRYLSGLPGVTEVRMDYVNPARSASPHTATH